jgi:hypothetical protein
VFGEILLLLAFFPVMSQTAPTSYEDADAYEVYAAILPSEWPLRVAHAKQLVIRRETKPYRMCLRPDAETQSKVGPAISDYVKQNEKEWQLQPRLSFEKPYQFLEADKFSTVLSQGGWDKYYSKYPESGGLIELSAVGFNRDKTVAVVYMGHSCGMLCGGGTFHVLEKTDGRWKALEWKGAWCSWVS